ncbi:2-oxo acid dehydrogenase subunit E2 [Cellulomonas sp. P24]|uniref:2-oxo acid dehydrogenase subunit E2 n=1 Tax=Cellulomonas sp. P24 TaxID=2885206 RepID=UPI00216ABCFD|nr:2-oxo acid dehydrogenase subunit E2 [Cellulomonas sp. P24]MCR6492748.1 2-oxo acid dehydrogenase subunit E2 [Cellulomonas sp. P24]
MPTFEEFRLPDAGEGLTEAEIVSWSVAVGDTVAVNQALVEIETAKSIVELPSPFAGVVAELLVETGVTVEVGTPIIVIDTDPTGARTRPVDDALPSEEGHGPAVLVGYGVGEHTGVRRARRGAPAAAGDPIREPAGDATAVSTSAPDLAATVPAPASTLASGSTPASGSSAPTPTSAVPAPASVTGPRQDAPSVVAAGNGSAERAAGRSASGGTHALAKPPVRKVARDLGVDLDSVVGTGPGGIVTREDVLAYAARAEGRTLATYPADDVPWLASGSVSADGRQTRVPVKSVRKRTAEAMVTSAFTAPHVTVFQTVDVTRTMRLVARLREDREFADVRVTPLLIAAKALLLAVDRHPDVNASWDEASQEIVYKHYVNLGIAAATPRGLMVPNIKDAHRMRLKELAQGLAGLTATARAGKTSPSDMSDGTITITNVGVFGIDTGTPILNPGEAAILAFGAIREQPWVHKGKIRKRFITQLALSVDHRLVDGELGSRVLADVGAVLEDPAQALVWG